MNLYYRCNISFRTKLTKLPTSNTNNMKSVPEKGFFLFFSYQRDFIIHESACAFNIVQAPLEKWCMNFVQCRT